MQYLIVAAHPDDEVLGAGASMHKWREEGADVAVCILSAEARARAGRPGDADLAVDTDAALESLGVSRRFEGDFPNIELNTVPHLRLVQFIEQAIIACSPDVVVTHHAADPNNDHMHTSLACQAAVRLFQRRTDIKPVRRLLFMEVLSATEWNVNRALVPFNPNVFVQVGEAGVEAKLQALSRYRGVMRDYPHPRSEEAIRGLAALRGAQAGLQYAEAFESVFERIL